MKVHIQKIVAVVLALVVVFSATLPSAFATNGETSSTFALGIGETVSSTTTITLSNGDVLSVPAEAVAGNYIVYKVRNGVWLKYVIDSFTDTTGVHEYATGVSFTRYTGKQALLNSNALMPELYNKIGYTDVLYQYSSSIFVKPVKTTFDYCGLLGKLILGADGTSDTDGDLIELELNNGTIIDVPRSVQDTDFLVAKSTHLAEYKIFQFNRSGGVYEGASVVYRTSVGSKVGNVIRFAPTRYDYEFDVDMDSTGIDFYNYPYIYVWYNQSGSSYLTFMLYASSEMPTVTGAATSPTITFKKGKAYAVNGYYSTTSGLSWLQAPYLISSNESRQLNQTYDKFNFDVSSSFPANYEHSLTGGSWSWTEFEQTPGAQVLNTSMYGSVVYSTFDYGEYSIPTTTIPNSAYNGVFPEINSFVGDGDKWLIWRKPFESDVDFDVNNRPIYSDDQRWQYFLYVWSDTGDISIESADTRGFLQINDSVIECYRLESSSWELPYVTDNVLYGTKGKTSWEHYETYNDSTGLTFVETTSAVCSDPTTFVSVLSNMLCASSDAYTIPKAGPFTLDGRTYYIPENSWDMIIPIWYTATDDGTGDGTGGDGSDDDTNTTPPELDDDIGTDDDGNGFSLLDVIKEIFGSIAKVIGKLFAEIGDAIKGAGNAIGDFFDSIKDFDFFTPTTNPDGTTSDSTFEEVGTFYEFVRELWNCIPFSIRTFITFVFSAIIFFAIFKILL